ncbi:hypothetical protein HYY74_00850 [Candidatus Woesearchaeota archaeon]|nr:hypothetical protein [Candidatus Woesearchaeota archaeon]
MVQYMTIDRLLAELEACPDERLTADWGVYDNCPMTFKALVETIASLLYGTGKYDLSVRPSANEGGGTIVTATHLELPVRLQLLPHAKISLPERAMLEMMPRAEARRLEEAMRRYDFTAVIHWNSVAEYDAPAAARYLVGALKDLAGCAKSADIPACVMTVGSSRVPVVAFYQPPKEFASLI